jgi:flagellar biosynthesis protein FlhA
MTAEADDFFKKNRDMLIIIGIVGIVVMMILPLPAFLVDILLALMISIALMTLMISMYLERVLDFSVFPGLLLVLSLFRISLNIATTRMILSDGKAGSVINSFGSFVTSGNIVVGTIIFIILVIVQFMVITKGSGRIAEVAARFTLDAMPGKQMAVDADLNAGIITEDEAKNRRKDISREADFYGAMDGASKFVKGDAVAGIIITLVNILGGFITGMLMKNMDFMTALETYTKLTIGDGLVSQTPSLMISTASGIIVTRAASSGNLGSEITSQFAQSTKALYVSSIFMVGLGLVPGMPTIPFLLLGGLLGYVAYRISSNAKIIPEPTISEDLEDQAPVEEKIEDYLKIDQMEMEIGYGLIALVDKNQGGDLLDRISMLRKQMASDMGIIIPPIRIRDNIQLQPNDYLLKIKGLEVAKGSLMSGSYLAMNPGSVSQKIQGIETVEPAFGLPALWITESQKELAELSGYTVVELPAVIATHLTEVIKKDAHLILTRQDVKTLVETLRSHNPAAVEDLIPAILSYADLQTILGYLLSEGVSVRDLGTLLEKISEAVRVNREISYLVEQCRQALSQQICVPLKDEQNRIQVMVLQPKLEQILETSVQVTERGPRLILRPEMVGKLIRKATNQVEVMMAQNLPPILLCSPSIRLPLRKLLETSLSQLTILSYAEIANGIHVQSAGTIKLEDDET